MKNKASIALILATSFLLLFQSCKKTPAVNSGDDGGTTPVTPVTPVGTGEGTGAGGAIVTGTDPSVASSQGFFLDNWQPKNFTSPPTQSVTKPSASGAVAVVVDMSQITTKVSSYIFGANVTPYMGQIVDQPSLLQNLTALSPNIIRAPGGSYADKFFFNADSVSVTIPKDAPASLLDSLGNPTPIRYWYGSNVAEKWSLSVDNYYKVLQQTNSKGIISVNYGYARYGTGPTPVQTAAHLAANWVRYDKGHTTYWVVGSQNYGNWEPGYRIDVTKNHDGQPAIITGALYGTHFKVFADSMRAAAAQVGNTGIKIGIVLTPVFDTGNPAGVSSWNRDALTAAKNSPDFFETANFFTPFGQNSSPAEILGSPASRLNTIMSWMRLAAVEGGVTMKPVAFDQWNMQAAGSKQMVSNVAGLHAVMVLGEALKNQLSMTCRWDLADGWNNGNDPGMFNNALRDVEPGAPAWNPRPVFYYMHFFQKYFGDRMVGSTITGSSDIVSYGSSFSSGQAGVVLVNQGGTDHMVNIKFNNFAIGAKYYYYTLNGGTDNAPFSGSVLINGTGPSAGQTGGPSNYDSIAAYSDAVSGGITVNVPKYGVVYLVVDKK